jgi:dihydroflavonol-4-reductase
VRGNVLEPDSARRAVDGTDLVVHAAAIYKDWLPNPQPMYEVALRGGFNVLEAARRAGVRKVVYTASIVALGRPKPGELGDERTTYDAWQIDFHYSRSKLLSRLLAQDFAAWGLDISIVCPAIVLGPGDIAPTPSGQLIINTLNASAPPLYMDGGASYVDVRDAAHVHRLVAERGRAGELYVASGHNLTNLEFLQAVNQAAGRSRRYRKIPVPLARVIIAGMERHARNTGKEPLLTRNFFEYSLVPSFFSNQKSMAELGATYRPFSETVTDAIAYFRGRGSIG